MHLTMAFIENVPHHANYYFMLANKLLYQQVTHYFYHENVIREENEDIRPNARCST